ncbi:hypothetical protein JAAARDRAFT_29782 [Jaapia argillacea MUCL 33604]|uniref:Uncharacterized protein n=1 Tax=Jaapia argillacea MUCL 33604 TaxID=933084 RepID=A0A067QM83_9AGAM|nr:hypothetical protein JAAARDRAFT_29782 [Jaapia argillacea MUCL 33604]
MADFVQGLDPAKLVLVETIMSFSISAFTAPSYNLPLFLFGIYVQENSDAIISLKTFTGLLGVSGLFDLLYMANYELHWFVKLVLILIFFLKVPTFLAFGLALRSRGAQFSGLGNNISGNTVWSMPGGFTGFGGGGREGYESVEEPSTNHTKPVAPPPPPQSGQAPGAYQSV